MSRSPIRLSALAASALLVVSACASGQAGDPGPATVATAAETAPCAPGEDVATDLPGWPLAGDPEAPFMPVVMSSLLTVGPSRFLYNALDADLAQLAAPDIESSIDLYALGRDAANPAMSAQADYLSSGEQRGLYRATVDFDCVGEWGAAVHLTMPDGSTSTQRMRFGVYPDSPTPAIGDPAPRSDSLTATADEVALVTTDDDPYPPAYDKTVAQTVTSGRPSLVFFATPAFCQTGFCGPAVDLVKSVARDYADEVEFVNVEPYELHETENGLRPLLDAEGHLQPVQAALDYAIPVEPYLFVVDAEGDIFARFEGVIGAEELRAAIEDALAAAPALG